MTASGAVLEFWAAQMVGVMPLRSAVASGHSPPSVAGPSEAAASCASSTPGSLQPVTIRLRATTAAPVVRIFFMSLLEASEVIGDTGLGFPPPEVAQDACSGRMRSPRHEHAS